MYKVFLVDDEEYVVKSLKARIDWEEYGFKVIGFSLSSNEAYQEILKEKPDLVFTDIRMPGMSGLELIKSIRDAGLNTLCMVISGYAEFAYAQKAVNYGAFGYCLKPFDDAEINDFLKRAKASLDSSKHSVKTTIMDLIEENSSDANESLKKLLLNYGIDFSAISELQICVSLGKDRLVMEGININLTLKIGLEKYAYFIVQNDIKGLESFFEEKNKTEVNRIGISRSINSINEIKGAIYQAEILAYNYFTGCKKIFVSDDLLQDKEDSIRQLEKAISKNDISSVVGILESIGPVFINGRLNIKHAIIIYNIVMAFSSRLKNEHFEDYIYSFDKLAASFGNVQQMLDYLEGILSRKLDLGFQSASQYINNQTVRHILKYVNDNFCEDISIQSISRHFKINANYVSQLFKKEVGIVFTEYLSKLRIDYACNLLKTTELSIGEISEKAGYNDYFYFSRVFKKVKGKSPSAFRME